MAEPILDFTYSDGTMTLTNGSDIVTGTFTSWDPGVLPYDIVFANDGQNGASVVKEVLAADQIRLVKPWAGPTLTGVPYFILRWIKHTDPKIYGVRVSDYLTRLKDIPADIVTQRDAAIAAVQAAANSATALQKGNNLSDLPNKATARSNLGISTFISSLLDDADAAAARATIGAQAALGYTPVQMGTGSGQTQNVIKLGWSAVGLKAQVDNTDLGRVWTDYGISYVNVTAEAGYIKFANGFAIQWGRTAGEGVKNFTVAFTALIHFIGGTFDTAVGADETFSVGFNVQSLTQFYARPRFRNNSGAGVATQSFWWLAAGV